MKKVYMRTEKLGFGDFGKLVGIDTDKPSTTTTTTTNNTVNNTGMSAREVALLQAQNNAALSQQAKSYESILNTVTDANTEITGKIIDAGTEAARITAEVAVNQANRTADVMKNADNNQRQIEINRINADVAKRQAEGAERLGMEAINSNERKEIAQMNTQLQAHALDTMSDSFAHMATLQLEGAMTSQENLLALADAAGDRQAASNSESLARLSNISTKSIDEISDLARTNNKDLKDMVLIMSEAQSLQNRINAEARDKQANLAMESQLQLTSTLLGPGGVQGLLGQQGNLFLSQQAQLEKASLDMQKLIAADNKQKEIRNSEALDELAKLKKELQLAELEKIKKEASMSLTALEKLTALQAKKPELIGRPVSENISGMISESIVSSTQNCKGSSSGDMVVRIGGTGNTVRGNTIRQANKFSSTCMQDVSVSYSVQTKIASTIIEAITISSRAVADSMGLDPTQIDRKVREEVASKFNNNALQEILNQANNKMEVTIDGSNNIVEAQVIEQINDSIFNSTQKIAATISFVQAIEKNSQSTLDSDTEIVSDESKNAADVAKTQALADALSGDNTFQMFMYFMIFVVLILSAGTAMYFYNKKKSGNNATGSVTSTSAMGAMGSARGGYHDYYNNY